MPLKRWGDVMVGGIGPESASGDILIVDDDEDIREWLALLLESEGYRVRTTDNGRGALAAIEIARPALVLLDLMMPIMSGWDVVDWVRRYRLVSTDCILLMSASGGSCPPGLPLIRKPFDTSELLAAIRGALARIRSWH